MGPGASLGFVSLAPVPAATSVSWLFLKSYGATVAGSVHTKRCARGLNAAPEEVAKCPARSPMILETPNLPYNSETAPVISELGEHDRLLEQDPHSCYIETTAIMPTQAGRMRLPRLTRALARHLVRSPELGFNRISAHARVG